MNFGPISGKVTASTVAAAGTTMVCNILGPYVFHGQVPNDIQGLIDSGIAAAVTFAAGYMARHVVPAVEKTVGGPVVRAVESEAMKLVRPAAPAPATAIPSSQRADVPFVPPVGG
ncbi:hypothetical protein [Kitasatospora cathayae]|uniref:Holin n=1 Tax=Kitasatospora cathayae TaxID=3004092 RepID=A0ABY7Q2X0_9ACTN|nr:hypothetical protein [Kitasatospora sp. HUAS 3-15]WBP87033.1 hypothetical protein O1G21_15065 [Kitasatospora sp. HUAS 3-15]